VPLHRRTNSYAYSPDSPPIRAYGDTWEVLAAQVPYFIKEARVGFRMKPHFFDKDSEFDMELARVAVHGKSMKLVSGHSMRKG
jgi:hypothetical protein